MLTEIVSELRYRLRALFRRGDVERELDDELHFHLERETEKYRREGTSPADAARRARLAFGGIDRAKEESREARGTVFLETTLQDIRYALRGLRAHPGFTLGVVVTLGLGIGANAAMFGITDRLLFRPPAYLRDADHVHRVYLSWIDVGGERTERNAPFAVYQDLVRWSHALSSIAAFQTRLEPVGDGVDARERPVTVASASYFDFFEAPPALGRYFTAQEDEVPQGAPVVVLGYAFWKSQFGGRADVLGQKIHIGRKLLCTIIGVAPDGFNGMTDQGVPAMYIPITAYAMDLRGPSYPTTYQWSWLELIARRKPGVTLEAANSDLSAAVRQSWSEAAAARAAPSIDVSKPRGSLGPVQFGRGPLAGPDARIVAWILGVALIVLLIACANVANLLLLRAVKRRREMALRLALGVSRGRLVRQLLTESLVLAAIGGALGLVTAQWGGAVLRALFMRSDERVSVVSDTRTLAVTLAVTIAAAIVTGVLPARNAVRSDLARELKAGGRGASGVGHASRTRTLLALFQVALSVLLLIGAGLFVRSLSKVSAMRLGYDVDPIVVVTEKPRGFRLTPESAPALENQIVDEVRAIPGVVSATPAPTIPFWSNEGRGLYVEGVDSVARLGRFVLEAGSPDYFRTMGTRVLRGRAFDETDRIDSPPVVLVGEGMARLLWPGQDPIGRCIRMGADTAPCARVIGVAEDMRARTLATSRIREFTYYIPMSQYGDAAGTLLVRVNGDGADFTEAIRKRLQAVMPGAGYVTVTPLRKLVDPNMRSWRFGATTFSAFGALALVLAAIGLYSVIAYGVAQRQQEIGVRIALGARAIDVVRLVLGQGVGLAVAGALSGSALALLASHWVAPLLFAQSARDPVIIAGVCTALLAVAAAASAIPALKAARVDPNVALRVD